MPPYFLFRDFEEESNESCAEAFNMVVSLKFPGDYVHFMVHGYYQSREKDKQLLEQGNEADDGFSESDDSVFFDAEEAPLSAESVTKFMPIEEPDKVDTNSM